VAVWSDTSNTMATYVTKALSKKATDTVHDTAAIN